ncbi:uncharacterized protein LOC126656868 [Mercurialis annua]|uniref:uncharacterized protein LOC126656868 n=1 Tax=Mercurialis annua TaxID=3986 RepID=UPI00215F9DBA|nr:uncharacterized protein LOC126656868 [Mercurialis annua]
MTTRISPILSRLVSDNQSAFVPKRSIAHNIMLAHDLVRNYHVNSGTPRFLLKIDLKKAYDSINWDFVEESLLFLNFLDNIIKLIMECIKSSSFYVNWNGSDGDLFKASCKSSNLNRLMFADDLLLFCHGDIESINFLNKNLSHFKDSSGLEINPNKSQVFFCNVKDNVKDRIMSTLGFKQGILPLRYLGIPLITTRLSKSDCKGITDKITSRIISWTCKFLSYAGRLQLIQGTYNALVSWNEITKTKTEGGLSIKSMGDWNKAAIAKHVWYILNDFDSLWVKWIKNNKLKRNSYWGAKANYNSSWIWRGLIGIKDKIQKVVSYKTGDGANTVF